MAMRPLAFGARFREEGRTVKVYAGDGGRAEYVVEVRREGKRTRRSEHASLPAALRVFAQAWRSRLH